MTEDSLQKLQKAMAEYDAEGTARWARQALQDGLGPVEAMQMLTITIQGIGDAFGRGELFLPDLVMAGEAMKSASTVLEAAIKAGGISHQARTLLIGTVAGDIHDIGKSLVATMFIGAGFRVVDLGIDVPRARFVDAVREHRPALLGLSALLSTTALEQGRVIEALKEGGLRQQVLVIVGGGAVSQELARRMGADGYAANAAEAVTVGERLLRGIGRQDAAEAQHGS